MTICFVLQISLPSYHVFCFPYGWPSRRSTGVSGRSACRGRPSANHGTPRDVNSGAVDDGVCLCCGDGGAAWVSGSCSCAPCGADCSGKFIVFFLPCCRVLTCFLVVCLRTYLRYTYVFVLRYTYVFICSILTYLFVVNLRTYLLYTYVFVCNILTYLFAVYLRICLQYTYVFICSILFRNKMWCVRIIINYIAAHTLPLPRDKEK